MQHKIEGFKKALLISIANYLNNQNEKKYSFLHIPCSLTVYDQVISHMLKFDLKNKEVFLFEYVEDLDSPRNSVINELDEKNKKCIKLFVNLIVKHEHEHDLWLTINKKLEFLPSTWEIWDSLRLLNISLHEVLDSHPLASLLTEDNCKLRQEISRLKLEIDELENNYANAKIRINKLNQDALVKLELYKDSEQSQVDKQEINDLKHYNAYLEQKVFDFHAEGQAISTRVNKLIDINKTFKEESANKTICLSNQQLLMHSKDEEYHNLCHQYAELKKEYELLKNTHRPRKKINSSSQINHNGVSSTSSAISPSNIRAATTNGIFRNGVRVLPPARDDTAADQKRQSPPSSPKK